MPSNEAWYVLRRVMRRAIRYGVKLGLGTISSTHHDTVIEQMGEAYPCSDSDKNSF